jgi:hypothetical protein
VAPTSTSKPKAMTWDEYADIVEAEWQLVLNDPACSEHQIQSFLEDHPCMLPGYDAFSNAVRREGLPPGPIYEAAFSQPRLLPGTKSYVPDFMWLPTDSQKQWVVLIEVENPLKPWFRQDGQQTQYFTQATGQIYDWMEQIDQLGNAAKFAKRYGISRPMVVKYCLIYGRRADAMKNTRGTIRNLAIRGDALKVMSFDRLRPTEAARDALCIKLVRHKFVAVSAPATLRLHSNLPQMWRDVNQKEEAVARSPHFSDERRAYLIERIRYWDQQVRDGNFRLMPNRE